MSKIGIFLVLITVMLTGACAHYGKGEVALPDGTVSKMVGNCVTNPISPTACYYANFDCKTEKQLGQDVEVCEETDSLIATQDGWVNPSQLGAAALIGKGLRDSKSTVNQSQSNTQTGGGATAGAFAKGGDAYAKGGNAYSNSNAGAVSGSVSVSNSTSLSNAVSNSSSSSGSCIGNC